MAANVSLFVHIGVSKIMPHLMLNLDGVDYNIDGRFVMEIVRMSAVG